MKTIEFQERIEGHGIPQGRSVTETLVATYYYFCYDTHVVLVREPKDGTDVSCADEKV